MKSYNHIFEIIISDENLQRAIDNSSLGKRDRKDVTEVRNNPDMYIKRIQKMLSEQNYRIPKHTPVKINDGITRKIRYIIKPRYKYEQIIHHAIVQAMMPVFTKGMYRYCCGSIPGRGAHYGKKYIEKFIRNNPADVKYCIKLDIHHFFQNINHKIMKQKLQKAIHDDRTLWLLFLILDAYTDHETDEDKYGLPLGYYTSQWLSNWYMQGLDHFIKEKLKVKCYVRYMDDMILFGRNKKQMHKVRNAIENYLKENLDLQLKSNWQVFRFEYTAKDGRIKGRALDFMGFEFHRNRTILRKSIMMKATKKAGKISRKCKVTWYDAAQMLSYLGWMKNTDTYGCYLQHIKGVADSKRLRRTISKHERMMKNDQAKLQKSSKY